MAPTRIIIDTDPGQDDAVAILLALAEREHLDLLGITTVAGNVPLPLTTTNALRILELAQRTDVPVFAGASQPLLRTLWTAEFVCGADGLEGAGLPLPAIVAQDRHAVTFLIETLREAADRSVTLCPIGPLTNIALAFAQAPELAAKVERIVLMGGARDLGNITPAAEFNFFVDPHAAAIVLRLPVPIVMFGLHATHQAMGTPARIDRIAALGTPVARAVHGMLSRPRRGGIDRFGVPGHPLHDPCVIAYLLWPDLFTGRDCHVAVETASEETIGRSTIDWWGSRKEKPNAHVIGHVDAEGFYERLTNSLAKLG
jgi:purine nucleosidase